AGGRSRRERRAGTLLVGAGLRASPGALPARLPPRIRRRPPRLLPRPAPRRTPPAVRPRADLAARSPRPPGLGIPRTLAGAPGALPHPALPPHVPLRRFARADAPLGPQVLPPPPPALAPLHPHRGARDRARHGGGDDDLQRRERHCAPPSPRRGRAERIGRDPPRGARRQQLALGVLPLLPAPARRCAFPF